MSVLRIILIMTGDHAKIFAEVFMMEHELHPVWNANSTPFRGPADRHQVCGLIPDIVTASQIPGIVIQEKPKLSLEHQPQL